MRLVLILCLALFVLTYCAAPQQQNMLNPENSELVTGQESAIATLAKHKPDTLRLNLLANAFVTGYADQVTVDVVVNILDPDRKQIASFDSPARGPEPFYFATDRDGIYYLVISPFEDNEGDYKVLLKNVETVATDPAGKMDQIIKARVDENGPGVSVAVSRDRQIIYNKGFGYANLEYNIKNTPQTIFHVASVSKQFTAFAIAMLADEGKLSLDDDVRKYIPELRDFGDTIRIRHLLHHTSGLRDQWSLLVMAGWRFDDVITMNQIMRMVSRQKELNFKPGEEMLYCNTGFTLMAEIVGRVSGTPFPEWMKEHVFEPLEMNSSLIYDDHEKIVNNRAYSYSRTDTGYQKSVLSYANYGATSLFTTVEDLSKWANNFETMKVGNANVMAMMEQKFVLNNGDTIDYALGQIINTYKGLKMASHSGADAGYRTFLARLPEQHFSVAVFSNLGQFSAAALSRSIIDVFLADELKEEPEQAQPVSQPEEETSFDVSTVNLSDYTGRFYSDELETFYDLAVEQDTLVAHHQRHDDFNIIPVNTDKFQGSVWFMNDIEFTRDARGKVDGMKVSNGRVRNLKFRKE